VPSAAFSSTAKLWSLTTGASFALLRLIVTVAVSVRVPVSSTWTVRAKLGVVSKSSAAWFATVISPVAASIAKAPPVLPAVIA
jgi:hypothetical protein